MGQTKYLRILHCIQFKIIMFPEFLSIAYEPNLNWHVGRLNNPTRFLCGGSD